ncbi:MAG: DUF3795 domain-containing protein [bacterium]
MIACCGLDCSRCEAYLATQADDDNKRVEVAEKWSVQYSADIKPEDIDCDGCQSEGKKFYYCSTLCQIRKCCREKKVIHCAACQMYACDQLKKFIELVPTAGEILEKLRRQ